jgi:hypothetical protein
MQKMITEKKATKLIDNIQKRLEAKIIEGNNMEIRHFT